MDLSKHESVRQRLERATSLQRRWTGWTSAASGTRPATPDSAQQSILSDAPIDMPDISVIDSSAKLRSQHLGLVKNLQKTTRTRPQSAMTRKQHSPVPSPANVSVRVGQKHWESTPRSFSDASSSGGISIPSLVTLYEDVLLHMENQGKISSSGHPTAVAFAMSTLEASAAILESSSITEQASVTSSAETSPLEFYQKLGTVLRKAFESVRAAVYADSVPFMSDTGDGTLKDTDSWLAWLLERSAQFQRLTTQRQVIDAGLNPLVAAHSESFMRSMKQRHKRGLSQVFKDESAFQTMRVSFRERREILSKHFRGWKSLTRQVLASRHNLEKFGELRSQASLEAAFLRWRFRTVDTIRSRRNEDMYRAVRVWRHEADNRKVAEHQCATSDTVLQELRSRINSLEAEVLELNEKLDDYKNPMVMDFRQPIVDTKTGETLKEGVVKFKFNFEGVATQAAALARKQHYNFKDVALDDQAEGASSVIQEIGDSNDIFFDFISTTKRDGIAQPRKEVLSSHYVIRVDAIKEPQDPSLEWLHTGAMAYCKTKFKYLLRDDNLPIGNSSKSPMLLSEDESAPIPPKRLPGLAPWEQSLFDHYSEFMAARKSFTANIEKRALLMRKEGGKNRCLIMTYTEPTPGFCVVHPGELSTKHYTYLAAAHYWIGTASTIAAQRVVAEKLARNSQPTATSNAAVRSSTPSRGAGGDSPESTTMGSSTVADLAQTSSSQKDTSTSVASTPRVMDGALSASGQSSRRGSIGTGFSIKTGTVSPNVVQQSFGDSVTDVHEFMAQLGCTQQIRQDEFADRNAEGVHKIVLVRLHFYSNLSLALDRDHAQRGRHVKDTRSDLLAGEGCGEAVALSITSPEEDLKKIGATSAKSKLKPGALDEKDLLVPSSNSVGETDQLGSAVSTSSSVAPFTPLGPSGVIRIKQCKSLLGMVTMRDGSDFSEDRSALEVLEWVRHILGAARATTVTSTSPVKRRRKHASPLKSGAQLQLMSASNSSLAEVNIRNLDEDFGDGLELLVSILHHLCPASHVPDVSAGQSGIVAVDRASEYLCKTAAEELKAHIPTVVRDQLYLCTPSVKLMFLTAVYNAAQQYPPSAGHHSHHLRPAGSANPLEESRNQMETSVKKDRGSKPTQVDPSGGFAYHVEKGTHFHVAGPAPYIHPSSSGTVASLTAGIPPCEVKNARVLNLFSRAPVVDAALHSIVKVWPLIFAFFSRRFFLSPLRAAESSAIVGLEYDAVLALCDDLGLLPNRVVSIAGGSSTIGQQYPQLTRCFLQAAVMNEDDLREDGRDLRAPWVKVPASYRTRLTRASTYLSFEQLPEFILRLTACDSLLTVSMSSSKLEKSTTQGQIPQTTHQQWQQQNHDRVVKAMKELSHRIAHAHTNWTSLETTLSGRSSNHNLQLVTEKISETRNSLPFKMVDPRTVRHQVLFPTDVLRVLKLKSNTLVNLFVSHSFFTVHTWRLLDHREMTCKQWLRLLHSSKILEVNEIEEVCAPAAAENQLPPYCNSTTSSMAGGFHQQVAVPIPDSILARIFAYVATSRRVKSIDQVPQGKVPQQSAVPDSAALEVKQPLSTTSSSKHGAKDEAPPPLTLGYSGFIEAFVALSHCMHPYPWLSATDRLSLLIQAFEQSQPLLTVKP